MMAVYLDEYLVDFRTSASNDQSSFNGTDDNTRISNSHYFARDLLVLAFYCYSHSATTLIARPAYRQGLSFYGVRGTSVLVSVVASHDSESPHPERLVGCIHLDKLWSRR